MNEPKFKAGDSIVNTVETFEDFPKRAEVIAITGNNYIMIWGNWGNFVSCNYVDHHYEIDKLKDIPLYQDLLEIKLNDKKVTK